MRRFLVKGDISFFPSRLDSCARDIIKSVDDGEVRSGKFFSDIPL